MNHLISLCKAFKLELMLVLPTLHGIQQTDYDMDDQASIVLLSIVQYLHQIHAQSVEVAVAKNSSPLCQMKQ